MVNPEKKKIRKHCFLYSSLFIVFFVLTPLQPIRLLVLIQVKIVTVAMGLRSLSEWVIQMKITTITEAVSSHKAMQ